MAFDLQLSFTGRILYPPTFFPPKDTMLAKWSAVIEVVVAPREGRNGGFQTQIRRYEIVQHGTAAIRAHDTYKQGDLVTGQAIDLDSRYYTAKDRDGKEVIRVRTVITASSLGLCTREVVATKAPTAWPPPGTTPRHAHGDQVVIHHAGDTSPATTRRPAAS